MHVNTVWKCNQPGLPNRQLWRLFFYH